MNLHLIELEHRQHGRAVGIVEGPDIVLLDARIKSCTNLFNDVINDNTLSIASISVFK